MDTRTDNRERLPLVSNDPTEIEGAERMSGIVQAIAPGATVRLRHFYESPAPQGVVLDADNGAALVEWNNRFTVIVPLRHLELVTLTCAECGFELGYHDRACKHFRSPLEAP